MKTKKFIFSLALLTLFSYTCLGQRQIMISMNYFHSFDSLKSDQYKADATSAFRIMSKIFSSQEFQDSLANLNFSIKGYCNCGTRDSTGEVQISGKHILNVLFSKTTDTWGVELEKSSPSALGATDACSGLTTAYFDNIYNDMCHLPPDARLAVNFCHEYMHRLGFCHFHAFHQNTLRLLVPNDACRTEYFDPKGYKDDVAYRVGWIVYDILKRPYAAK